MNENHKQLIDKLNVDLTEILEQIYIVTEWEQNTLVSQKDGFENSETGLLIQKTISDLENAEMHIHHAIDLLGNVRD